MASTVKKEKTTELENYLHRLVKYKEYMPPQFAESFLELVKHLQTLAKAASDQK